MASTAVRRERPYPTISFFSLLLQHFLEKSLPSERSVGDNQRNFFSEGRLSAAQRSFRRIGTQSLLVGTQYAGKEFVLPNSLKEERGTRNAERSVSFFLSGGSIAPS